MLERSKVTCPKLYRYLEIPSRTGTLNQELANLLLKIQIVNILGLQASVNTVVSSVTAAQKQARIPGKQAGASVSW